MNSSISRGWVERKRGLKHEELWTKHDPSVLSLSLSPPIFLDSLYGTRRSSLISRSFHWQRMCTMFTEALYVPHRDLGRRTQTSPTSLPTYICQHEAFNKTHTSLRCSMLDRLYWLCLPEIIIKLRMKCDEKKKKNKRTKKKKKNVTPI